MGPATLLCPPGTLQVFGQVAPSKVPCQKVLLPSSDNVKHLVYAHWTRSFLRPSPLFFPSMPPSIGRRDIALSSWRALSAAAGGEVLVEEAATEESNATPQPDEPTSSEEASSSSEPKPQVRRIQPKSSRNATVSVDDLVPGAVFPGKVTTIQSFGAFVDFGAFTNGLAHISRLSKSYVKKVEDVVQVGQEVSVKILDVDLKSNRISLMLEGAEGEEAADNGKQSAPQLQQPARAPRRRQPAAQPTTKLKKGEIVTGVVKNIIRSGVFLSLPEGIDGYLPALEVVFKGPSTNLESEFQVGQEVSVRVLRVEKGRVTLSTKKEVDFAKINEALNKGLEGGATNPFELAFRQSDVIGSFLVEREKQKTQESNEVKESVEGEKVAAKTEEASVEESAAPATTEEGQVVDEVKEVVEEMPPVKTDEAATAASEAVLKPESSDESAAPAASEEGQVVDEVKEVVEEVPPVKTDEAATAASEAVLEPERNEEPNEVDVEEVKEDAEEDKSKVGTEEAAANAVTNEAVLELQEAGDSDQAKEDAIEEKPATEIEDAPAVTSETVSELLESEELKEQDAGEKVKENPVMAVAETGEASSLRSEADVGNGQQSDEEKEVAGDENPGVEAKEVPVATSL